MTDWRHTTDLVVVGSGGGGLTAALVAQKIGLDALLLEKTAYYGGSTARSGGGLWIPNHYLLAEEGVDDSLEQARMYMAHTVGNRVPQENQEAFLVNAPKMIAFLRDHTHMHFQRMWGYADYYPERPGGMAAGRSLEPVPFDGKKLGDDLPHLRPPLVEAPWGFSFSSYEYNKLGMLTSTWKGKATAVKIALRTLWNLITCRKYLTMGQALVARLRYSLKEAGIPLWLNCPFQAFIVENGRVVGIVAQRNGRSIHIKANRGVVLAAGGFPHNKAMRQEFHPHPITTDWTVASPGNTGDTIRAGMKLGLPVDFMDDAWWGPSTLPPDAQPFFHVGERGYPGAIMVNAAGHRFTNESASYVDVVHDMYELHSQETPHIPAYFIMDQRFRRKYLFGVLFPGQKMPPTYLDSGYVKKAKTLAALAEKAGINPENLVATVERFNQFANTGKDEDFGRGDSAYDNYYGDPTVKPNPNLAPIKKPPFFAVEMFPGDLGTKGGLVTDEYARVLQRDGSVMPGLYAIGNTAASVMGHSYPGAGSTLGPAMTFGYIAAQHAAQT